MELTGGGGNGLLGALVTGLAGFGFFAAVMTVAGGTDVRCAGVRGVEVAALAAEVGAVRMLSGFAVAACRAANLACAGADDPSEALRRPAAVNGFTPVVGAAPVCGLAAVAVVAGTGGVGAGCAVEDAAASRLDGPCSRKAPGETASSPPAMATDPRVKPPAATAKLPIALARA